MSENNQEAIIFKYEKPELTPGKPKKIINLARTDLLRATAQLITEGGENMLHRHKSDDGFFMVMNGRCRFFGEGGVIIADLGKYEGALIPRGLVYSFESLGDEPLEILRVGAQLLGGEPGIEIVGEVPTHIQEIMNEGAAARAAAANTGL